MKLINNPREANLYFTIKTKPSSAVPELQELWEVSCRHRVGRGHSWAQGHTNNGECDVKPLENQLVMSAVGLSGLLPTFVSNEHYLS